METVSYVFNDFFSTLRGIRVDSYNKEYQNGKVTEDDLDFSWKPYGPSKKNAAGEVILKRYRKRSLDEKLNGTIIELVLNEDTGNYIVNPNFFYKKGESSLAAPLVETEYTPEEIVHLFQKQEELSYFDYK